MNAFGSKRKRNTAKTTAFCIPRQMVVNTALFCLLRIKHVDFCPLIPNAKTSRCRVVCRVSLPARVPQKCCRGWGVFLARAGNQPMTNKSNKQGQRHQLLWHRQLAEALQYITLLRYSCGEFWPGRLETSLRTYTEFWDYCHQDPCSLILFSGE